MKISRVITVLVIFSFLSGCTDINSPAATDKLYEYKVSGYDNAAADILYRDGDNQIVELAQQDLPWSVEILPGDSFTGMLYVKADIPQSDVFSYFSSGNANADENSRLVDTTADFVNEGVVEGDVVYTDLNSLASARVAEIESSTKLKLNTDLFELGNEPYYIFHMKTLTVEIIENGELLDSSTEESEKILSVILMESVAD